MTLRALPGVSFSRVRAALGSGSSPATDFFSNGINLFFNATDYNNMLAVEPYSPQLVNQSLATTLGLVDSGSTNGTWFDSSGNLQQKTSGNGLRLNFVSGNQDSLLCEPASTNISLNSSTVGGTGWSDSGSAVSPAHGSATVVAPDGTNYWRPIAFAASADSRTYSPLATTVGGTTYTQSIYAYTPSGTAYTFRLFYYDNTLGTISYSSDLTVPSTANTPAKAVRLTWTFTVGSTTTGIYPGISNKSAGTVDTGAGASYWGQQVEAGSVATSFIPTVGSTVTRSASLTRQAAANIQGYSSQGTWLARTAAIGTATIPSQIIYAGDAFKSAVMQVKPSMYELDLANYSAPISTAFSGDALFHTHAARFQAANYGISLDGSVAVAGGDSTSPAPARTWIYLGLNYDGNSALMGAIRRLAFSPTLATNTQLAQLSAGTL